MIELSRNLARMFRAVVKKIGGRRDLPTVVVFRTDPTGLRLQARNGQIAVEYSQAGSFSPDTIAVPAEALADFENRKDIPVRLDTNQGSVVASWQDKAVPQVRQYGAVESDRMPKLPAFPTRMDRQTPELLQALQDGSETADTDPIRYAVNCLQLRGRAGQIVGTDGRQLLVQGGFTFAWDDEVLVPASAVFGCRELHGQEPITLGRTNEYITLSVGPWTLHLAIEKQGRFPNVDSIVAGTKNIGTIAQLDPADRDFLLGNLDSLPGATDECSPVTVDANGQVTIRAKGEKQCQLTEVLLARSTVQGKKVNLATERAYLARALRLGFTQIGLGGAGQPIGCQDEKRQYIWLALAKEAILAASNDAIRLSSADSTVPHMPASTTNGAANQRKQAAAPATKESEAPSGSLLPAVDVPAVRTLHTVEPVANDKAVSRMSEPAGIAGVLAEAEAIKELLRQAYTRTHQLVTNVKRYRKQAQMVKSALGSLRQLQEVAD